MGTTTTTQPQNPLDQLNALANAPTVDSPIGVPKGYKAVPPSQWSENSADSVGTPHVQSVPKQYTEGDQYSPANLSKAQIAQLQKQLAGVGLISKGQTFQLGVWDQTSATAYKGLLGYANQLGVDSTEAMSRINQSGGFASVDANGNIIGTGSSKTQKTTTNSDDIKAIIQSVAPSILGQRAPDDVVAKLVSTFHSLENKEQDQANSGADVVEKAPSSNAWFEEQLRTLMPETVKAQQTGTNIGTFSKLLDGQGQYSAYHG